MRDSLPVFSSKEFLIFCFFLAISATFWFLSTLNDTYEKEYPLRVEITDIPHNVVITEPLPDTIRVVLRDKGYSLLEYAFNNTLRPIHLRFAYYAKAGGKGSITQNDIQKILKSRTLETTSITAVKSDRWDFYYSYGEMKKVPIVVEGQLLPAPNYFVTRTVLTPDSASVYAATSALDTIKAVYTEPQNIVDIKESATHHVALQKIIGARIEPSTVRMSLIAEQMTEVTVSVPVTPVNVPEGVMLKTFPARVDVKVTVSLSSASQIKPELFNVVADYNDLSASPSEKLKVKIMVQPRGIVRAALKTNKVDYILENF
jgi:hypothetical protein